MNKFENDLADSIAQIIDNETQDAKLYVDTHSDDMDYFDDDEEEEKVVKHHNKKKNSMVMMGCIAMVSVVLITLVVVFMVIIKNNTKNSFSYNYSHAKELFNDKKYEDALQLFNKALNNSSAQDNNTKVELNMYIYDCYTKLDKPYGQVEALKNVLVLDKFNEEALSALAACYKNLSNGAELNHLIETYKNSKCYELLKDYIVAKPVANINTGVYDSNITVELSSDQDSKIYYTTDGSIPTAYATQYTEGIEIAGGVTELKIIAINEIGVKSDVMTYNYEIKYGKPAKPVLSAISGTYSESTLISITNLPEDYTAYYTWNGSSPSKSSTEYNREEKIEMIPGNNILSVIIYSQYDQASDVATYVYDFKISTTHNYEECLENLIKKLTEQKVLKSSTVLESGEDCRFVYYTLAKNDDDNYIYIYYFDIFNGGNYTRQSYMYGVDGSSLDMYKVLADGDNFKFEPLQ